MIPLNQLEGVSALVSPEILDQLAELLLAKLTEKNAGGLLPKQAVASSSLVSRSNLFAGIRFLQLSMAFYSTISHIYFTEHCDPTTTGNTTCSAITGILIAKVAPSLSLLSAYIRPPCSLTMP